MGMEPVARPRSGLRLKAMARPEPMMFWKTIKIVVTMAILKTMTPPRLMRLMLAV